MFSNLKTNGTNRKFIIFLKLKAKRTKNKAKKQKKINNAENKTKKLEKKLNIAKKKIKKLNTVKRIFIKN